MAPREKPVYVVAGNFTEFSRWAKQNYSGGAFRYVDGPQRIYGMDNVKVIFLGTWRERKDIEFLLQLLKYRRGLTREYIEE